MVEHRDYWDKFTEARFSSINSEESPAKKRVKTTQTKSMKVLSVPKPAQYKVVTRLTIKEKLAKAEVRRIESLKKKVETAQDSYLKFFTVVEKKPVNQTVGQAEEEKIDNSETQNVPAENKTDEFELNK